jgi:bleomycin hydrolase
MKYFTIFSLIMSGTIIAQVSADGTSKYLINTKAPLNKNNSQYEFTVLNSIKASPVVSQGITGTCWSFSTSSFFESEINRVGKMKDINLSEMFTVRNIYPLKADNYVRMHGRMQFAEGGEPHDVLYTIKHFGMMPEEAYMGRKNMDEKLDHRILDSTLLNIVKTTAMSNGKINADWKIRLASKLDSFLGKAPASFDYKGKNYTPESFALAIGINPNDYVSFTSFTHHPFDESFVLEIPDNWAWQTAYNLPLESFYQIAKASIQKGYSLAWAADVSEKYFRHKDGIAFVPEADLDKISKDDCASMALKPMKEKVIDQDFRQLAFDNFETQDDHAMHIVGLVKDQNGTNYFVVKNSWGNDSNDCGGFLYVSESYFKYKSISFMVHKNALSADLLKKVIAKGGLLK